MSKKLIALLFFFFLFPTASWAKGVASAPPALEIEVIDVKYKGSWTQVGIAIKNIGNTEETVRCCSAYLENETGFAIASLKRADMEVLIHNKARTGALIGTIAGVGLGLGGAIGGVDELVYAGIALGGASAIGGVVGEGAAESQRRNIVIDDIMRDTKFPVGLKVAGYLFFPPKRKWPGGSRRATAIHLTYEVKGKSYEVNAPVIVAGKK